MVTWNSEVIERIKTGSVTRASLFGDGIDRSVAPYVTVKPIAGGDRKVFQFLVHFPLGNMDKLEAYLLRELPELFASPLIAPDGTRVHLRDASLWGGPYTDGADNTIVMTRDFWLPVVL
jgi:hypothetical protein